jgi:hypothetical protein
MGWSEFINEINPIPFPRTDLLYEEGNVLEKLFNRNLADRSRTESMIDSDFGEILLGEMKYVNRKG